MEEGTIQARLLDLVRRAHADEQTFIARLTEAERTAFGTLENWSAKDLIAHIAAWQLRLAGRLTAVQHGEPLPELRGFDEHNAEGFEANRDKTWSDVEADSERAYAAIVAHIMRLSEAELADPKPFPWYNRRPLRGALFLNSYFHPVEHLVEFHLQHGEQARANQLIQASVRDLGRLEPTDAVSGLGLYNLACLHARAGEVSPVIELLSQVFPYRPELKEWAKQDSDLAALRDLPEYQLLLA